MSRIDDLIEQIQQLESEVQVEFDKRRGGFLSVADHKRIHFVHDVAELRRSKVGLFRYVSRASILTWITAPVIYAGIIPLLLLDLFLFLYQAVCFPVYRIARVKRGDYVVLDRGDLPYLNVLESLNCLYCGYANGMMALGREVAARTEQYFCPIKHARRVIAAHDRYPGFLEYGDAQSYRKGLERLRDQLRESGEQ